MIEKIKKIFNKLNNYVEKMSKREWLFVSFLICLLVFVSLSIEIIWQPFIFAEDGTEFLKDALKDGFFSITNTYGGYISVIPRIFALVALQFGRLTNSAVIMANVMKWLSILFTIVCVNYFNSEEFKWLFKNRLLRLVVSLSIMFIISNQVFLLYNSTYTHWWGGFLVALVGLNLFHKKTPPLYILPFVVLSIISSPSGIIIGIPVIYYIFDLIKNKKTKGIKEFFKVHKKEILIMCTFIIFMIIQVYAILFLNTNKQYIKADGNFGLILFQLMKGIIKGITGVLSSGFYGRIPEWLCYIIGILIWIFIIRICIKKKYIKLFWYVLITSLTIYFLVEFKAKGTINLPPIDEAEFYATIPFGLQLMLFLKVLYEVYKTTNKKIKICIVIIFMILFTSLYFNIYEVEYLYCKYIYMMEPYVDFNSNDYIKVPIAPGGNYWKLKVPINREKLLLDK